MKTTHFYDPVYEVKVYILVSDDQKEVDKFFIKNKFNTEEIQFHIKDMDGLVSPVLLNNKEACVIVYFNQKLDFKNTVTISKILAHEVYHVQLTIYEHYGVLIDTENQEPHAHYYAWLLEQVLTNLDKLKEKVKKVKTVQLPETTAS